MSVFTVRQSMMQRRYFLQRFARLLGAYSLIFLLVQHTTTAILQFVRWVPTFGYDGLVYLAAARAIAAGQSPYSPLTPYLPEAPVQILPYLYPPVLAIILTPLALVPYTIALNIWMMLVAMASLALIPLLRQWVGWPIAIAGVLLFVPVYDAGWHGQINAFLAVVLTLSARAALRNDQAISGRWLALGALLKLTPGISLLVLAARGHWRAFRSAVVVGVGVVIVTLPVTDATLWRDGMITALTTNYIHNQVVSWTGLFVLWFGQPGAWIGIALTFCMLGLTFVRAKRIPLALAFAASILVPLLIARITWPHHSVMALPALALIWKTSFRGRLLAAGAWLALTLWSHTNIANLGFLMVPIALTVCWICCCWPKLILAPMKMDVSSASASRT